MVNGDTGADKDKDKDEERPLTTVEAVMELWSDGDEWNLGLDYGLDLNQIMTQLGDPPKDSPEWKIRAKNMHSLISGAVVKKFKREHGLFFGPIKVAKGRQMKYCLAQTAEEFHAMYMRAFRRLQNCARSRAEERLLVSEKRRSLPESFTRQSKLLDGDIRKRIRF